MTGGRIANLIIGLVLVSVAPALYALHYFLEPAIVQIIVDVVETIVEFFWYLSESHSGNSRMSCMARDILALQVSVPDLLGVSLINLQSARLGHFLVPFGKLIKTFDPWHMLRVLSVSTYRLLVHQDVLMSGIVFVIVFRVVLLFFCSLLENYFTVGFVGWLWEILLVWWFLKNVVGVFPLFLMRR